MRKNHQTVGRSHARTRGREGGFSLFEVLIALVILSIGLLGAVGMQAAAMQANKETRYSAVAANLSRQLADRMRNNFRTALKTVGADNPYLMDVTLNGAVAMPGTNCFDATCGDGKTLADWDVAEWQNRAQALLPTPRIVVCFDKTPYDAAGKPQWACSNDGDTTVIKLAWTHTNTLGTLEFSSAAAPMFVLPLTAGNAE